KSKSSAGRCSKSCKRAKVNCGCGRQAKTFSRQRDECNSPRIKKSGIVSKQKPKTIVGTTATRESGACSANPPGEAVHSCCCATNEAGATPHIPIPCGQRNACYVLRRIAG